VFLDYIKFFNRQLCRFEEYPVGDGNLADIMQLCRLDDRIGVYGVNEVAGVAPPH
jgi:hypothetical protein